MKIRKGFVSNSSSSSFICDVSGVTVEGYDMSLDEADMYCCENEHYFLSEFLIGEINEDFDRYYTPKENCPICMFKSLMSSSMVLYIEKFYNIAGNEVFDYMKSKNKRLRKVRDEYWFELLEQKHGVSKLKLEEEIKSKFNNLDEFVNALGK